MTSQWRIWRNVWRHLNEESEMKKIEEINRNHDNEKAWLIYQRK